MDANNHVCYQLLSELDYWAPEYVSVVRDGIHSKIEQEGKYVEHPEWIKIDSLPELLSVLRHLQDVDEDDEENFGDDLEEISPEGRWSESGDLNAAEEVILVCGEYGTGDESFIHFDSNGNEYFAEMRERYSEADDDEKVKIIDEAVRFFHDLPEWEAYTGYVENFYQGFLYTGVNDRGESGDREDCEYYLENGIDEVNAKHFELAFIDPKTFVINKTVNVLSFDFIGEEDLEELLKRLHQKNKEKN